MALPLALHCRHVVAVEPSPSMAGVLEEQAQEHCIGNISVIRATWEEAEVDPGDITLCCHVLYTIQDIEPFMRKLEAQARKRVLIVLYSSPPQAQIFPLWREIHGQERLPLPSLPQLKEVLQELGIDARVQTLAPQRPRGFDSMQQAADQLSRRLYLSDESPKKARLVEILPQRLVEEEGVFYIQDAPWLVPGLVSWEPARE